MNYEINTEIVFSSGHITERDNETLEAIAQPFPSSTLLIYPYDGGYRIHLEEEKISQLKAANIDCLSDSFWKLAEIGVSENCQWLRIDCDGQTFEHLETFNW